MNNSENTHRRYVIAGGLVVVVMVMLVVGILLVTAKNTPAPANLSLVEEQGKALFLAKCNGCHPGEGRHGNLVTPPLSTTKLNEATNMAIIKEGKGGMPGFPGFSMQETENLVSYLRAIQKVAG